MKAHVAPSSQRHSPLPHAAAHVARSSQVAWHGGDAHASSQVAPSAQSHDAFEQSRRSHAAPDAQAIPASAELPAPGPLEPLPLDPPGISDDDAPLQATINAVTATPSAPRTRFIPR